MVLGRDIDGAIVLDYSGTIPVKMVIGQDSQGYIVLDYNDVQPTPIDFPDYGRDIACARIITCTNANGEAIILTERKLDPFILCSAQGIYTTDMNVITSENSMMDGGIYQGSVMNIRNIVLTIKDIEGHDANRELIDVVFDKNIIGTLEVQDGTHRRAIDYYVEKVETTATPITRLTTISLICPDPYFYDPAMSNVFIASLVPKFEFIHEFSEYGEEIGRYSNQRLGTIYNKSADDKIGVTMIVKALGHIENPIFTLIETQEHIALGTLDHTFGMEYGDIITVNTITGQKNVYDANGNSINAYLTEDSTFFQLHKGENTIGYAADTGADYMTITVMYRYKYVRA